MKREELEAAIRHATRVTGHHTVLVIGSQSILGSYTEVQLPDRATFSEEVDIAPLSDDADGTVATILDVNLGEWSEFHTENGFYVQGVNTTTAVLPTGWEKRVVIVDAGEGAHGMCLDPHDLCAAKLVRGDPKDIEFVGALVDVGIIDAVALVRLCRKLPVRDASKPIVVARATAFLARS